MHEEISFKGRCSTALLEPRSLDFSLLLSRLLRQLLTVTSSRRGEDEVRTSELEQSTERRWRGRGSFLAPETEATRPRAKGAGSLGPFAFPVTGAAPASASPAAAGPFPESLKRREDWGAALPLARREGEYDKERLRDAKTAKNKAVLPSPRFRRAAQKRDSDGPELLPEAGPAGCLLGAGASPLLAVATWFSPGGRRLSPSLPFTRSARDLQIVVTAATCPWRSQPRACRVWEPEPRAVPDRVAEEGEPVFSRNPSRALALSYSHKSPSNRRPISLGMGRRLGGGARAPEGGGGSAGKALPEPAPPARRSGVTLASPRPARRGCLVQTRPPTAEEQSERRSSPCELLLS
ncbi:uncharacterized protein LOC114008904 [Tupaia chinensis]|uniref:uncharacterized protein LOC114008904 n=1 Tax=Tupaia chinensis TaxID=246437 RepID=UPI0003C91518|nr:uncharacterized protein LOC114008904 [Tupaia chinensis]